jgi:hypothetical protein
MGKVIIYHAVERKPGYLYYINLNGDIVEQFMIASIVDKI